MAKASSGATRVWFLSTRRRASILAGGHLERLAMVRFLTFPPSRQPSRRRMAGGELRLGTVSMYMVTDLPDISCNVQRNILVTW